MPNPLLPFHGSASYYPDALTENYFDVLHDSLQWRQDVVKMFGKTIVTRRLSAWYGENGLSYRYAGFERQGLELTSELRILKTKAEEISGCAFNSVLANYYHDGADGMGWHTDAEKELDPEAPILSLSFGVARRFSFRHKATKDRIDVVLENGSALIMDAESQRHWQHSLPKALRVKAPRINLTFRRILA